MSKIDNILRSQNTYIVLIAGLLVMLPLLHGFSTGALIVLLVVSLASVRYHKVEFRKEFFLPILFYLLMVASLLWSDNVKASSRGLERQLALLLIPLAFAFMPRITKKTRNIILYYFSLGMSLFAFLFTGIAMANFIADRDPGVFFYHSLVAPLGLNAIYISVFVSLCILFLLFNQKKTMITILAMAILSIFLLMLSSKIIVVATSILGVFGVIRTFKRATIFKLIAVFAGGILLLVFTSNPIKQRFEREISVSNVKEVLESERFNKVYDWTGTTIRLFQARIFSEMLREDNIFLMGYGISNSEDKIIKKQKEYNLWQGYYTYNFHNQYIQAFAELGVFGLLFLFLMLGVILRQYMRDKDILFLALFFIMFVVFITESYLWRQRGLYHFLILFCLLFKTIPIKKSFDARN
jgi:O-antigen ligase